MVGTQTMMKLYFKYALLASSATAVPLQSAALVIG